MIRLRHPMAYAIVRPVEATADIQLEAVPSRMWLRTLRECVVVAVAIDRGAGRTATGIRAALEVTILDPALRTQIETCLERLAMGEAMAAEDGLDEPDLAVAGLLRELPDVEPPLGWEERALERARRDGVLPQPDGSSRHHRGAASAPTVDPLHQRVFSTIDVVRQIRAVPRVGRPAGRARG